MDERYNNFLYGINTLQTGVLTASIFGCLDYNENVSLDTIPNINSYAERVVDKKAPVGIRSIRTVLGNDEEYNNAMLSIIRTAYDRGEYPNNNELFIDYRLLSSQQVLDFLKESFEKNQITYLKITGNNFSLDEDTYNKISYMKHIVVDESLIKKPNVLTYGKRISVDMGINDNNKMEIDFFIKENITDNEIDRLVNVINESNLPQHQRLNIRFYNPIKTVELIETLDKKLKNTDVSIEILGYPLTENSEIYEKLSEISKKRKIDVNYSCCHDLLHNYCNEPFAIGNSYRSELEPNGKTSLDIYVKMLKFIENFENNVKNVDSNVEKAMIAYQFLHDNYYYATDNENQDYNATRDVDKIFDSNEIVCVGYSNLLSIMCRRVNIPMFTYGAPQHQMNIARIIDKDENGNIIVDKICTFDATNDGRYYNNDVEINNNDSYTFFGLDPEATLYSNDPSFLTLANSLVLPPSEFEKYTYFSRDPFEIAYSGMYNAASYRYSMLNLMGYNFSDVTETNDILSVLQEQNRIGGMPSDVILNAARNIERRKYPDMSEEEFEIHMNDINSRINNSFEARSQFFDNNQPMISLISPSGENVGVINVKTYHDFIDKHKDIDINSIDVGPVYYKNNENQQQNNDLEDSNDNVEAETHDTVQSGDNESHNTDSENQDNNDAFVDSNNNVNNTPLTNDDNHNNSTKDMGDNVSVNDEQDKVVDKTKFDEDDFSTDFIAGTSIRKPRYRKTYESDTEYEEFLKNYYTYYFPKASAESSYLYNYKKDQIIQDLPIYSLEEQKFNAVGMSIEEINVSKSMLR